jgi:serine/threonine-protein kinase
MPTVDADRNLIFGILALQMDFITRDALIAALNAWVLEKSRPLGRVLREQGALAREEHDLLDALVRKHLEKHRDDADESLSSLGRTQGAPEGLADRVVDPALRTRLARLEAPGSTVRTDYVPTFSETEAPGPDVDGASRFRILRSHAEGGLGRVFVALDRELNREVALKQIKEERLGMQASRARFVFEAEVTGNLEHPGIVPVYSMGHDDEGRPYYAMRMIKGGTLKEAIRRHHADDPGPGGRSMDLRRLIGRLIAVCNAVAYAHSRGVIHRDLKPSNIMLGKYGETLVVDWGLAKAVDRPEAPGSFGDEGALRPSSESGEAATVPGSLLGTPEYMSPEQATGRAEAVGVASDVYSLGATLYSILTGRPPFDRRLQGSDFPAMVQAGDFPPPRRVKRDVPPALEAICRKAMSRRPEDRYASAMDLASDLEHWLADEPATAYREPVAARAGRWVRRHKPIVAAAATLMAAGVVGLAVNNELVRAQRDVALLAEAKAEASRRQEAAARQDAEANLALARSAVDKMLVKVAEEQLPNVPGLGALRRDVAHEALGFARQFLGRRGRDPAILEETAMILRRVANIERLTGDFAAALPHYEEAEALYERLIHDFPREDRYRDLLAQYETDLAEALKAASRLGDALIRYDRAHAIAREQLARHPDSPGARRTLALAQDAYAVALHVVGRSREGLERCDEAVAVLAELAGRRPLDSPIDPLLSLMAMVDRAPMQREAGRLDDAEAALARSVAMARSLLARDERDANVRFWLAVARSVQGRLLAEDRRRPAEAEAAFDESVRLLAALRGEAPEVRFYRPAQAEALSGRASARLAIGRLDEAEADAVAAQRTLEAILDAEPRDTEAQGLLASALAGRAKVAGRRGDRDGAAALWDQALARQEALARDNPRSRRDLERLRVDRVAASSTP